MHDNISDLFSGLSERTVTIRSPRGQPLLHVRLLHAAGVAAAGVILAPRLTAIASLGILFKGFSVKIDPVEGLEGQRA